MLQRRKVGRHEVLLCARLPLLRGELGFGRLFVPFTLALVALALRHVERPVATLTGLCHSARSLDEALSGTDKRSFGP